jgi:hypothetical protein
MTEEPNSVSYKINGRDELIFVDENWLPFAQKNAAGDDLAGPKVLGKSLWAFVRDPSLQIIYRSLLTQARTSGQTIRFEFRCDSPSLRRHMRMRLEPGLEGEVHFTSRLASAEPIELSASAAAAFSGFQSVRRCSVCNLYQSADRRWVEIDELTGETSFLAGDRRPSVIWTVCGECRLRLSELGASG